MNLAQIEAISPILATKISLSANEVDAIIAFLTALEDAGLQHIDKIIPASIPSGLPVSRLMP
jgi:hypothetical protein